VEAERIVALMPHARLVVHKGKGHWPWLEEPGFVRAQVAGLLERIAPLIG
jgi:pimeloyl-ACP methyl ester carboxylesterase